MNTPVVLICSLFSLLFGVVIIFWLYRQLVLDIFRQKMFALRDELFDEAAQGGLDFSHPAYGMLRGTMNGLIRFGHRMNMPFAIFLTVQSSRIGGKLQSEPFHKKLSRVSSSLAAPQRDMVKKYHKRMNFLLVEYLVFSSPVFLFSVILPVVFAVEAKRHVDKILSFVRRPLDKIDSVAYSVAEI